jgi:excisionase family DNA binding protein
MESRRHLSPDEFAQVTGMSVKTVRRRLKAGKLPADQSGGPGTLWLIDYDAFLAQISNGVSKPLHSKSALPEASEREEKISGPRPKWTRLNSNSHSKRGYGPKKTNQ